MDKRADIWAFGVVLYEMVAGGRLFEGETVSDTLAAVLTREPDYANAPEKVRRLLRRCLEKDPRRRLRDIGDWAELLDPEVSVAAPSRSRFGTVGWVAWVAAGLFALSTAAVSFVYVHQKPAPAPVVRAAILPPENAAFNPFGGVTALPAVSPDGQRIAFSARSSDGKSQLWARALDSVNAQPLAGTENGSVPFWSPDGRSIGFFAGGKLNRIDAAGGPALAFADAGNPRGASWSAQGVIVFAPNSTGPLRKVLASGGAASEATKLAAGENTHRWPWFLPDGKHFLFAAGINGVNRKAIRVGSLDTLESTKLLDADSDAIYSAGYLLFLRGDTLMAQPFDARRLALSGEAIPVVELVQVSRNASLGAFSASANGLLAYAGGAADFDLAWSITREPARLPWERRPNSTG